MLARKLSFITVFVLPLLEACSAQDILLFEAEDVSTPTSAWQQDVNPTDRWNLWSKDKDAHKKWSGGKVLQSPKVMKDRIAPEAGAPPLHVVLENLPNGVWSVSVKHGRALAASLDGKEWMDLSKSAGRLGEHTLNDGRFECWLDDRFASKGNPGHSYFDTITLTRPLPSKIGVVNGTFESGTKLESSGWNWWSRDGGGRAGFSKVSKTIDGGPSARCVFIDHPEGKDWALTNSGRLSAKPGEYYSLTAWMKCAETEYADVSVVALSKGQTLSWNIGSDGLSGTHEWKKLTSSVFVPDQADQILSE